MKKILKYGLFVAMATIWCASYAAPQLAMRTGKLSNGLTYYIWPTKGESGQVGVYLVQNVGSLMEEDNQQGLAHFLEHMAFNASQNFPGQIDRFLQGHNLTSYNAYTGTDETVYNIDNIPGSRPELVDSCLLVVRDWCHSLSLPQAGIDKERGIILEEWRTRRDGVAKAREKIVEALYNGSRYAYREVIGDTSVLIGFGRKDIVDYYNRWYKPSLQAVVVAGDVDADRVERFIKRRFGDIPSPAKDFSRPQYTIPNEQEPRYVKVVEPELGGVLMEFTQRFAKEPAAKSGEALLRRIAIVELFNSMIAARIAQSVSSPSSSMSAASASYGELVRGYDALTVQIVPLVDNDFRAVYQLFEIMERAKKFGFTQSEFDTQRDVMERRNEGFSRNINRIGYQAYVMLCQNHYLGGVPIVEPGQRAQMMSRVLSSLTVQDVDSWMRGWANDQSNRVFMVSGNKADHDFLTLDDILMAEQDVQDSELTAYVSASRDIRLVDFPLEDGKIVKQEILPIGGAHKWTLSNGVTVCFRPSEEGSGRFSLRAESRGGLSLVEPIDIPAAEAISQLAFASGVYNTDRSAMVELMQGRDMEIEMAVQSLGESVSGESVTTQADEFFEMLYLGFARARFDQTELSRYTNELRNSLSGVNVGALDAVMDTIRNLVSYPSPRTQKVSEEYIARIEQQRVERLFKERFGNAADFTFYISGDLGVEQLKALVCRYMANLPVVKGAKREDFVIEPYEIGSKPISRVFEVDMPDDKASVDVSVAADMELDRTAATSLWVAGVVLQSRLTDEIRERLGGSYNINVSSRYNENGRPRIMLRINFETSSVRAQMMAQAVSRELDYMVHRGVTEADVRSIVTAQMGRMTGRSQGAGYWIGAMSAYVDRGIDQTIDGYMEQPLRAQSAQRVNELMREVLTKGRKAEIVVRSAIK